MGRSIWRNKKEDEAELHKVVQIFSFLEKDITPRKIIAYINEVVGIYRINSDVPLRYIALFAICKESIQKEPLTEIIRPTYLKGLDFIYKNDNDLPKYIAALYYQIDPESAIQIVYTERLTKALNNNDKNEVKSIYESPVFEAIIDDVIPLVENVENAALTLAQFDGIKRRTWDDLYHKVKEESIKGQKITEGQLTLLEKTSYSKEYIQSLLEQFTVGEVNLEIYTTNIDKLVDKKFNFSIKDYLPKLNVVPNQFMELVRWYESKWEFYNVYCQDDELNKYLSDEENEEYFDFIMYIKDKYDLSEFREALTNRIKTGGNNKKIIEKYLPILKETSSDTIEDLLEDNQVYSLLSNSNNTEDVYFDAIAMRIAKFDSFNSSYANPFTAILNEANDDITAKVVEQIEYYTTYGDILINLTSFNNPLTVKIANLLTSEENDSNQRMNINTVLAHFDEISDNIDEDLLFAKLNGWRGYLELNETNIKKITPTTYVYNVALKAKNQLAEVMLNNAVSYLDQLSHDIWKEQFKIKISYEVMLSHIVPNYEYTVAATDAFKTIMNDVAKGNVSLEQSSMNQVLEKLQLETKQTIFRNIRDLYCSSVEVDEGKFQLLGIWLFEFGDLDKNSNTLRRIFKPSIVRDESCLDILILNKEKIPTIVNASDESEANEFKATIRDLLNNDHPKVSELAQKLGIRRSRKKEEPKEESAEQE